MKTDRLAPHEIRNLRRTLGMTQERFGQLFDRDASTIFRWENGVYDPDPASAAALVRLWNDVQQRKNEDTEGTTENLSGFAKGLIAGGIFGYLISKGGTGTSEEDK